MELDTSRCRELLAAGSTGRVGLSTPLGPEVVPVDYAVVDDSVIFWTSPFSLLARCTPGTVVAFQVDRVDPSDGRSWCVQARGRLERLEDASAAEELIGRATRHREAWPTTGRRLYLRLRWFELSGHEAGATGSMRASMPSCSAVG